MENREISFRYQKVTTQNPLAYGVCIESWQDQNKIDENTSGPITESEAEVERLLIIMAEAAVSPCHLDEIIDSILE